MLEKRWTCIIKLYECLPYVPCSFHFVTSSCAFQVWCAVVLQLNPWTQPLRHTLIFFSASALALNRYIYVLLPQPKLETQTEPQYSSAESRCIKPKLLTKLTFSWKNNSKLQKRFKCNSGLYRFLNSTVTNS